MMWKTNNKGVVLPVTKFYAILCQSKFTNLNNKPLSQHSLGKEKLYLSL